MYEMTFSPQAVKAMHARVKAGVKFLQRVAGARWYRKLTPATLKLDDVTMCVLGQTFKAEAKKNHIYSGFDYAVEKYGIDDKALGFNLTSEEEEAFDALPDHQQKNATNPWTLLGELWISEIAKAKRAAISPAPRVAKRRVRVR